MDRTFDYRPRFDYRSRKYSVGMLLGSAPRKLRSYTWRCLQQLDQGREGACVGFAFSHELAARPVEMPVTAALARAIYHRAQVIDSIPGENYSGTSLLAGAQVMQERGLITQYRWAFGEEDLAAAIGYLGPAVLGIEWYEGMTTPDAQGWISPTGRIVGGHAILCRGFHRDKGYYRLRNSWGPGWGIRGDCLVSREHMAMLLKGGEACIPLTRGRG